VAQKKIPVQIWGSHSGFTASLSEKIATAYQSPRRHNPQELNFKFPVVPIAIRAENNPDGSVPFVEKN
jgi:hypothetical protein